MTSPAGLTTPITNPPGGPGPQPVRSPPAAAHQYRYTFTRAEVERVLPPFDAPPLSVRELHARMGVGAEGTVRHALCEMEREGIVAVEIRPARSNAWPAKLYRAALAPVHELSDLQRTALLNLFFAGEMLHQRGHYVADRMPDVSGATMQALFKMTLVKLTVHGSQPSRKRAGYRHVVTLTPRGLWFVNTILAENDRARRTIGEIGADLCKQP